VGGREGGRERRREGGRDEEISEGGRDKDHIIFLSRSSSSFRLHS
jgi:hypothetical protein